MTGILAALIDGNAYSLAECDWVMWEPCGCPSGVCVARAYPSEGDAWKAFYDRKRDRDRAERHGARLELMTHERWGAEVMPLMKVRCPHEAAS